MWWRWKKQIRKWSLLRQEGFKCVLCLSSGSVIRQIFSKYREGPLKSAQRWWVPLSKVLRSAFTFTTGQLIGSSAEWCLCRGEQGTPLSSVSAQLLPSCHCGWVLRKEKEKEKLYAMVSARKGNLVECSLKHSALLITSHNSNLVSTHSLYLDFLMLPLRGKKTHYKTTWTGEAFRRNFKLFAALIVEIGTLSEFMNEASEMISAQTDGFPRWCFRQWGTLLNVGPHPPLCRPSPLLHSVLNRYCNAYYTACHLFIYIGTQKGYKKCLIHLFWVLPAEKNTNIV